MRNLLSKYLLEVMSSTSILLLASTFFIDLTKKGPPDIHFISFHSIASLLHIF